MTRLITKAALLSACGMLVAVAAMAGIPSAGNSTSPAYLRLAASTAGVPDSISSKITVTVRDIANNVIANSFVTVDFSNAVTTDIKIGSNQLNANYTVNCANHTVSAYTNAAGQVAFTLLGGSWAASSYSGAGAGRIYADGVLLSSPTVAAFDLNGTGGLTAGDLSILLGDIGSHTYRARSDVDLSGALSAGDLSTELGAIGRHGSNTSATVCP
jgi:hypothetical protein